MQSVLCPLSRACGTFVVVWHWSVHQCAAAIDRFTCERVLSACARLDQISCSACSRLWRADRSPIGIPEICGLDCTRSNAHDQNVLACGQFDHDRCALFWRFVVERFKTRGAKTLFPRASHQKRLSLNNLLLSMPGR